MSLSEEELYPATLLKRYKRFLAEAELVESKKILTVHCPNPGSMIGLADEGRRIWLRKSMNPKNKLPYAWVLSELPGKLILVDTLMANKLVKEFLRLDLIPELSRYGLIESEKKFGQSRFDFFLSKHKSERDCYVEVKSVTLSSGNTALFPDAKTERGRKHLLELIEAAKKDLRAVQLFLVCRQDTNCFSCAANIDVLYGQALRKAAASGVEILVYSIEIMRIQGANSEFSSRFRYLPGQKQRLDL